MYPRNAASPPRIAIGPVVQISDGAVQTAGVSVKVIPQGGTEASGGGTVAYSEDGVVVYTPTQGETDYTAMVLVASKAGCIPATVTVVTSASTTAGYAGLDWSKVTAPTTTVALTGTTISATQIAASVTSGVTVTTNNDKTGYSLSQSFPANFAALDINSSGHVSRVTLVDTTTTNTDMRGTDNALLVTSYLAPDNSGISTLLTRLSATRASFLDNLNINGPVASQADINAINQSASRRIILTTLQQLERPESNSTSYQIEARTFDGDGAAVNADSSPTLTPIGMLTGSLATNLSSVTNTATGVYRWTYSVSSAATLEQIRFDFSASISSSTFTIAAYSAVVDLVSATWTTTDSNRLNAIYNKLPSRNFLAGVISSTGELVAGDIYNQLPSGDWVDGSFGDRMLVSTNNNRTVFVTGSAHVAVDVHAFQPDVIDSNAIATSAVNELQAGIATITNQTIINDNVLSRLATSAYIAPDNTNVGIIKSVTDKLNTGLVQDGGVWQCTANFLELTPTSQGGGTGSGARIVTITVNDGTNPLQNATVRLTEGANTFTAPTNASGIAVFNLDDATYSVSLSKSGYTFSGTSLIVNGTETETYSMTQVTITPGTGNLTTGYLTALNESGSPEADVIVYVEMVKIPSNVTGYAFDSKIRSVVSAANGLVTIEGLIKGATYRIYRGDRSDNKYVIPVAAGSTYELPSIIGREQ